MYFVQGADGKEYGPASAGTIRAWIREGRVNFDTLLRKEGSEQWGRVEEIPDFNPQAAAAPVEAGAFLEDHGPLSVMESYEKSWELFTQDPGLLVLVSVVFFISKFLFSLNPYTGYFYEFGLHGILFGGLILIFLKRIRGEPAGFGEMFVGFVKHTQQLVLASSLCAGASLLASYPILQRLKGDASVPVWLLIVSAIASLVLSILLFFVFPLVIDRGLPAMRAIGESMRLGVRHAWRVLALQLFGGLLIMLGFICLFVGILIALPLFFGAVAFAYLQATGSGRKS